MPSGELIIFAISPILLASIGLPTSKQSITTSGALSPLNFEGNNPKCDDEK